MTTRAEIMQRLSALPTEELLHLLRDETIFEIASRYFERMETDQDKAVFLTPMNASVAPAITQSKKAPASDRAKRPLNAFMAFRSYYLKLFPDAQQKTASGFLTTLWNKDPFRNKWALIAKVYSFVRDEIGKSKVSLAYFLSLACPAMRIIEPSMYLAGLGWSVNAEENGPQKLRQEETRATMNLSDFQSNNFPSTEIELLSTLVNVGYLPDQSYDLVERMSSNNSSIMTSTGDRGSLQIPYTKEKIEFMSTVRSDPIQASKELLSGSYDQYTLQMMGVNSHNVKDLDSIEHLPMQVARPDPRRYYNYSTTHSHLAYMSAPIMNFDTLPDHETFDIDSPWDLDAILGQTQQEGELTAGLPVSPQHDAREDFHYMF